MTGPLFRWRLCLAAVRDLTQANSMPPTYAELGEVLHLNLHQARRLVMRLIAEGYVTRIKGSARTLVLTKKGRSIL